LPITDLRVTGVNVFGAFALILIERGGS